MAKTLLERFNEKYTPEPMSGCWLWTAAVNNQGYGVIQSGSRGAKLLYAHRASYEIHIGKIPDGLELDHKCRVPCCVNPQHLEPVTHRDNVRRGNTGKIAKTRYALITHCPHGHEYNDENTYIYPTPQGHRGRSCKKCGLARVAKMRKLKNASNRLCKLA